LLIAASVAAGRISRSPEEGPADGDGVGLGVGVGVTATGGEEVDPEEPPPPQLETASAAKKINPGRIAFFLAVLAPHATIRRRTIE
jgi:hypothetical protein